MAKLTKDEVEAIIYKLENEIRDYNSNLKKQLIRTKEFKDELKRFKLFMDQYETKKDSLNLIRENLMPLYTYPYLNPVKKTEEELQTILLNHHLKNNLKILPFGIRHEITLLQMSSTDINSIIKALKEKIFK